MCPLVHKKYKKDNRYGCLPGVGKNRDERKRKQEQSGWWGGKDLSNFGKLFSLFNVRLETKNKTKQNCHINFFLTSVWFRNPHTTIHTCTHTHTPQK